MSYALEGHGRLDWAAVKTLVGDARCAWADLNGFRVGPCPGSAPPYTHLWGWEPGRWVRVRIDRDGGIVGVLTEYTGDPPPGQPVEVDCEVAPLWPDDEKRVGQLPAALAGLTAELRTIRDPRPVTFVALREKPAGSESEHLF
ncbi:MAG: hypothetical protein ACRDZO_26520 [Egibacteraceae bacterium]